MISLDGRKNTFFIAAPFGNYIYLKDFVSVYGSFTLYPRPGRLRQVIKTIRYKHGAWHNKLGLRNPGISSQYGKFRDDAIYSLATIDPGDFKSMWRIVPSNISVELNISCPNVDHCSFDLNDLALYLGGKRRWCIVKLSPLTEDHLIDTLIDMGFRHFHCCNTLNGESGHILKFYNTYLIKYIKEKCPDSFVIGGGGIYSIDDVKFYRDLGADGFSLATIFFNPLNFFKLYLSLKWEMDELGRN
jgi:dihydroorotate dehydrogenase